MLRKTDKSKKLLINMRNNCCNFHSAIAVIESLPKFKLFVTNEKLRELYFTFITTIKDSYCLSKGFHNEILLKTSYAPQLSI